MKKGIIALVFVIANMHCNGYINNVHRSRIFLTDRPTKIEDMSSRIGDDSNGRHHLTDDVKYIQVRWENLDSGDAYGIISVKGTHHNICWVKNVNDAPNVNNRTIIEIEESL